MFSAKLFYVDAKFSLVKLDRIRQCSGEDLDIYVKRFHDKALDSCGLVEEEVLVNVCLYGMIVEVSLVARWDMHFSQTSHGAKFQ